jgi:hypothetical protein
MISTHAQLTATIEGVLIELDKVIASAGSSPGLSNSKRWLQELLRTLHKKQKPSKSEVKNLQTAAKTIREVPMRMPELDNQLWDIEDFVEAM